MKIVRTMFAISLIFIFIFLQPAEAISMSYLVSEDSFIWLGTDSSRTKRIGVEYDYTYGDESSVTFHLPWTFPFFSQSYNQITADTNGNVWFSNSGASNAFELANTGRGPVIACWHDDLSSYYYGGVFIQHITEPEDCVVVEWLTETYSDEGYFLPNNFEVVLYPNGRIELSYKSFTASSGVDNGSGVSKGDGTDYTDLGAFGPVYTLANRSFSFVQQPQVAQVQVNFLGDGHGTVKSTPSGIFCNTACSSGFSVGSQLTLHAEPLEYYLFGGWSGGECNGFEDCLFNLTSDMLLTATFVKDVEHQVAIEGSSLTYEPSIQAAYNVAPEGSVLKLWGIEFYENLLFNKDVTVSIKGGFDSRYTSNNGTTALRGSVVISKGTVQLENLEIR